MNGFSTLKILLLGVMATLAGSCVSKNPESDLVAIRKEWAREDERDRKALAKREAFLNDPRTREERIEDWRDRKKRPGYEKKKWIDFSSE